MDPITREMLGSGEKGEVMVRGECVMKGYWKRPEATAETIDSEGWQKTGEQHTVIMHNETSIQLCTVLLRKKT